jgi:hypothetical protein
MSVIQMTKQRAAIALDLRTEDDPILALIAEADRLRALARAADERTRACHLSVNNDLSAGWPPLDEEGRGLHIPGEIGDNISRGDIERFNESVTELTALFADTPSNKGNVAKAAAKVAEGCAARLAWWDRRQAEREHNGIVSGYRAAADEADALWQQWCDAHHAVCEATAVTVAGAMAQLRVAVQQIIIDHTNHGTFERDAVDINETAVLNVYETLARLLPAG